MYRKRPQTHTLTHNPYASDFSSTSPDPSLRHTVVTAAAAPTNKTRAASWKTRAASMDFYGVAESKNGYNNILGATDLVTAISRLSVGKTRSVKVLIDSVLHGIVLRDGCPRHIHSDTARECISKAMQRLCHLIGCQQTTNLDHNPSDNATIERL